jgi:hypothetical protein
MEGAHLVISTGISFWRPTTLHGTRQMSAALFTEHLRSLLRESRMEAGNVSRFVANPVNVRAQLFAGDLPINSGLNLWCRRRRNAVVEPSVDMAGACLAAYATGKLRLGSDDADSAFQSFGHEHSVQENLLWCNNLSCSDGVQNFQP